jgi:WD40 repeat protein
MSEYNWDKIITEGKIKYGDKEETFYICKDDLENMRKLKETFPYTMGVFNSNEYNYNDYLTGFFIKNEAVVGIRLEEQNGTFVGETIGNFKHLQLLRFSANSCNGEEFVVPKAIENLKSLKGLEIYEDDGGSFELPEDIEEPFPNLEVIILWGRTTKIPNWIGKLPKLRSLKLMSLNVKNLPNNFKKLSPDILNKNSDKDMKELWMQIHGIDKIKENSIAMHGIILNTPKPTTKKKNIGSPADLVNLDEIEIKKFAKYTEEEKLNDFLFIQKDFLKYAIHCGNGLGHNGDILDFLYLKDNLIASLSTDQSIVIWNTTDQKSIKVIILKNRAYSMDYSEKNNSIAIGENEGYVQLFNAESFELINTIIVKTSKYPLKKSERISRVKFSKSTGDLFTADMDENLRCWEYNSGNLKEKFTIFLNSYPRGPIGLFNNEDWIIVGIVGIEIYSYSNQKSIIYASHSDHKILVPFSMSNNVYISSRFGVLHHWDLTDIKKIKTSRLDKLKRNTYNILPFNNETELIFNDRSGVKKMKLPELETIQESSVSIKNIQRLALSPNKKEIASISSSSSLINLLDSSTLDKRSTFGAYKMKIEEFIILPKRKLLVCSYESEPNIYFFGLEDLTLKMVIRSYEDDDCQGEFQFDVNENYLLCASCKIRVWNLNSNSLIINHSLSENWGGFIMSKDGSIVIVEDNEIIIWNTDTGEKEEIPNENGTTSNLILTDDNTLLITAYKEIMVFDIKNKKWSVGKDKSKESIRHIKLVEIKNEKKIIGSSYYYGVDKHLDNRLNLWDLKGNCEKTIIFEKFYIKKIIILDFPLIFSLCSDKKIRIFDLDQEIMIMELETGFLVKDICISKEFNSIYYANLHGDIIVLDIKKLLKSVKK